MTIRVLRINDTLPSTTQRFLANGGRELCNSTELEDKRISRRVRKERTIEDRGIFIRTVWRQDVRARLYALYKFHPRFGTRASKKSLVDGAESSDDVAAPENKPVSKLGRSITHVHGIYTGSAKYSKIRPGRARLENAATTMGRRNCQNSVGKL